MHDLNSVERHILMTISPVRVDPRVLRAAAVQPPTGDDAGFIAAFGRALKALRTLLDAPDCQPFILPGSGTLGMEAVMTNWLEPGDPLLVVSSGFWGDRFADVARRHGIVVTHLMCEPGHAPDLAAVEVALTMGQHKAVAWTHVDSSTGVVVDNAALASMARRHGALSLVDGVAGAGAEPFSQAATGVDVYLTASPKGLACLAGIILITANQRAMQALNDRDVDPMGYATDLRAWTPVMEALEAGRFGYFNTPATNLVLALAVGLDLVLAEGMPERAARHERLATALHAGLEALNLAPLAVPGARSRACTTIRYPEGVDRSLLDAVKADGIVLAGGYHPVLGPLTFRIGHLGWVTAADVTATIGALGRALVNKGAVTPEQAGRAVAATAAGVSRSLATA